MSRLLLGALRGVDAGVAAALADRGAGDLRPSQAFALLLVERAGTRLTDLAARAGITRQAMMQVVDDLQAKGFVRRTGDPSDGRAKIVRMTARGRRHRAEARRALAAVEARTRRRLGDRRYDAVRAALAELAVPEG